MNRLFCALFMIAIPDTAALQSLDIPIPPRNLRYRIVTSHIEESQFIESGRQCVGDIMRALNEAGVDAGGFSEVLDFGCGCARVLRFFVPFLPHVKFSGCDIDKLAITWDREHLPGVDFELVPHLPPTPFAREKFDFIYGLSVFSHLDLPRQILWLDELRGILKPGGVLLLTVHGAAGFERAREKKEITPKQQADFETVGFVFVENIPDKVLPEWYQTAIFKERFARLVFGSGFSVLRYDERGMTGWQDVILMRKQ